MIALCLLHACPSLYPLGYLNIVFTTNMCIYSSMISYVLEEYGAKLSPFILQCYVKNPTMYDLIMTSETIYRRENYNILCDLFDQCVLPQTGRVSHIEQ